MNQTTHRHAKRQAPRSRVMLPPRIRMLYITNRHRTGRWLAEAFAADSASEVMLEEAQGEAEGVARLRDEAFDVVLLAHDPEHFDVLELIEGLRAGGTEEPLLVLGEPSEQELAALCYEVGADGYLCVHTTTTRSRMWVAARAIERHQLIRDNRRLWQADRSRLEQEQDEAERLLRQQRALVDGLEGLQQPVGNSRTSGSAPSGNSGRLADQPATVPDSLVNHYRELLRAYVIMGSGNLGAEMNALAELLATAGFSAQQTLQLHIRALEELLHGLGSRSSRHVMNRADLLVLEVMVHLVEEYRQRRLDQDSSARQRHLPGFECAT